jgi:hypothetical protein
MSKRKFWRPSGAVTFSTGDNCLLVVDIILNEFEAEHLARTN